MKLNSGKTVRADLVILSIGARSKSQLTKEAGRGLNQRGGIAVDDHMRTSDRSIYAVGDVIEVEDFVYKERTMVPLDGSRQQAGADSGQHSGGPEESVHGYIGLLRGQGVRCYRCGHWCQQKGPYQKGHGEEKGL